MSDPLTTYLQDHLAGSIHAIELLKAMREHHVGEPLGEFATDLLVEIESDRDVLANLTESLGGSVGGPKEWSAWLAEKVSRLKLKHGSMDDVGTFEALEFLVLGIHGKWALWRALWCWRPVTIGLMDQILATSLTGPKVSTRGWIPNAVMRARRPMPRSLISGSSARIKAGPVTSPDRL